MHECEAIITHHFGDLLFTTVFIALRMYVLSILTLQKAQNLLLARKKQALLLKCLTAA